MANKFISIKDLQVGYQDNVLFQIDHAVFEYEKKYLILGNNGTGKSTLLRLFFGLERGIRGSIEFYDFHGEGIGPEPYQLSQAGVSYLPQSPIFPRNIIVINYFELLYSMKKTNELQNQELFQLANKAFGLNNLLHQKMEKLSLGTIRKIMVVASLLGNPKVLLWDEPFANWDDESNEFRTELLAFIEKNKTLCIIAECSDTNILDRNFQKLIIKDHALISGKK